MELLTAVLLATAVTTGVWGFILFLNWRHDAGVRRALERQLGSVESTSDQTDLLTALVLRAAAEEPRWIRTLLIERPAFRRMQHLLKQAGLEWQLSRFFLYSVVSGALGVMFFAILGRASAGSLVLGSLAIFAPALYALRKKAARLRQFEAQLADAIDLLARALRAGHPLSAGFKLVAEEAPEPTGTEFRRVFEEQRFGLTVEESLQSFVRRMDLLDVRMLVTAIMIQREVGGNLAEVLDTLSTTIRTRFSLLGKIRANTAQARLSGYVVGALPFAVGLAMYLINPDSILPLFQHPLGRMMLAIAVGLQALGVVWIRTLVNIRV